MNVSKSLRIRRQTYDLRVYDCGSRLCVYDCGSRLCVYDCDGIFADSICWPGWEVGDFKLRIQGVQMISPVVGYEGVTCSGGGEKGGYTSVKRKWDSD